MGYWEGLLGGFTDRKSAVEQENLRQGDIAAQHEQNIFKTLLASDDPETQKLALAGMLDSANPRKRKSGLRGWIGETMSSPYLGRIQSLIQTPVQETVQQHGIPSTGPGEISTEQLPHGHIQPEIDTPPTSAAMPGSSPVQGGPPPPAMRYAEQPPAPYTVSHPRQVFMPPLEKYKQEQVAKAGADIEGDVTAYMALGMTREQALEQVKAERMRRGGGAGATGYQSIAGELPNGQGGFAPAFGVFDRTIGGYRDPVTHEVLQGFRPRTSTGSTSLGADRESVSRELFGKPATQLAQPEIAEVDAEVRRRAVTLPGEKAMATPLTPDQAAGQAVPFGTTMGDLQGIVPVTEDQRKRHDAAVALAPQIEAIKQLIPQVFPAGVGLRGALKASEVIAAKRAARDPTLALLDEKIALAIGNISRVLAAETGRLTEQDVMRAQKALTDLQGWTDTQESALVKLQDVDSALRKITADLRTPGDILRGRQGVTAAPAGTSAPSGTVPGLFVGADGQLHTESPAGPIYQPGSSPTPALTAPPPMPMAVSHGR